LAYSAKVGSFNIDTAKTVGQTQAITDVGFQPKIVLFWWGGSTGTGDTVAGGTYNLGFGAAISSTSRFCINGISEDAQAESDTGRSLTDTCCMLAFTDTGTLDGKADFSSMDAGGFTLVIDDQFTQAYRISYLALGGTDLTNVKIGQTSFDADAGPYGITGVGFQPDAIIAVAELGTYSITGTSFLYFMYGMATGASNQGAVMAVAGDNQATSVTAGYGYNAEFLSYPSSSRHAFVSMDADGFTLANLEGTRRPWPPVSGPPVPVAP